MAIIRNTASALMKGRVGNTTYYVANRQQVARQSKNNSNYGESASRTQLQQTRRVKWSNLVNCYKQMAFWQKKAYESLGVGQSDYNKFMQLNVNNSTVALTRDMAASGAGVWEPWQIAQGSLEPIAASKPSGIAYVQTSIALGTAISSGTTIAQLSADILENNAAYSDGDNIAVILFQQSVGQNGYYYPQCKYYEFTLNTQNTALYSTLPVSNILQEVGTLTPGHLGIPAAVIETMDLYGVAFVHTRKSSGKLLTSSQSILLVDTSLYEELSSQAAVNAAVASYGVVEEVPLDPSFNRAVIYKVRINGSEIPLADSFETLVTGQATLEIEGEGFTSDTLMVEHDGVTYTPLQKDGNVWTYILGNNGDTRIYLNDTLFHKIVTSGVVVPSVLPARISMRQKSDEAVTGESTTSINYVNMQSTYCINYSYLVNEGYPYYLLLVHFSDVVEGDFACSNCTINNFSSVENLTRINMSVTDPTKPAYITYQGFIIAVFNYTA